MFWSVFWALVGLVLIMTGANALTDGASSVARRMGVSDLIIGLTVVAMGTSAPELVVSIVAALDGSAPLAIGNVVGSNIFNVFVIIGLTALVRPIVVEKSVMSVEIPIVILAALTMLVLGNSVLLDGAPDNVISRVDGIFLLIAFGLYMRHTFLSARLAPAAPVAESAPSESPSVEMPMWRAIVYIVGGLAMLVFGGDKFVDGASGIASSLGVSDAVIGLTIVAAGTSLPELATSLVAAYKGQPGLAVGNVIGSCIFNVFMVLGAAAVIHPLPFGSIGNVDLLTMLLASVLFWLFGWKIKERTITRAEGGILAALYVAYTVYLVINA